MVQEVQITLTAEFDAEVHKTTIKALVQGILDSYPIQDIIKGQNIRVTGVKEEAEIYGNEDLKQNDVEIRLVKYTGPSAAQSFSLQDVQGYELPDFDTIGVYQNKGNGSQEFITELKPLLMKDIVLQYISKNL